jgi:hypothetical protein
VTGRCTGRFLKLVVWVPDDTDFATVENVARFNAAGVTEKLLRELES